MMIDVDLRRQRLELRRAGRTLFGFDISSSAKGAGERRDSHCTPRGWHEVCEKIGGDSPVNTVFVARRPTGEIYDEALRREHPGRDWILTRILWLSGLEPGRNLGGEVDTRSRYIYLHGSPDDADFEEPGSIGCIRMRNADVVDLFGRVPVGTRVHIHE